MWSKVKSWCLHSSTVAITYATMVLGFLIDNIDSISSVVGTQDFKDNLAVIVGNDPVLLGRWMMVISIIVFIGRLRSLIDWRPNKDDR
jgi:hypothetical protein